ncbi:ATP-dependent Clp protease ATP-binding subunit ClpA homolog CD4A, chloroplastic-like isoform X2 [Macadamia integrifolia]|nr:ATP-dependent Clp protease ATP-binding subunit ClpA homolog CD4A, chloroplastic-like isoform X2 [Macadamia integrifolia]XP_042483599.1 ATP-dependent Clp protease ATP-binding subunit ClpA homolog CD4A, chloroplastic-like isoform X2 [Macadamia integrifolia]
MGRLVPGTKFRGKFEKRLTKLMDEVKQSNGEVLLFIDEVHMLMITGAANILKPALARGDLQCSGATTQDEYKEYIQKDRALERRFQPVKVPEPSISEAIQILKQISPRYEIFHKLNYTHEALVAAVELSKQLISDRYLPDKAIDLIDEAGAFVRICQRQLPEETNELYKDLRKITEEKTEAIRSQNYSKVQSLKVHEKKIKLKISEIKDKTGKGINANGSNLVVTEVDIQHIVSSWTGIPVKKVSTSESRYLLKMEESICKHVIGQEAAMKAICRAIRRARVGIRDPARPIVSLLFAGSTGVGKTQLVKVLATEYFGSKEAMVRFDMSEFMEMHSVSKLIGAPPGYVGYQEGGKLTETVHRRPFTVVLFDEIEKAHRDVFNIMLQILEDGRLTDSKGKTVDFCNTVIIMTSNIGSSAVVNGEQQISTSQVNAKVVEELKKCFRLEFLNRLDDVIVFQRLTEEVVRKIAEIMLNEVIARLKKKGIYLKVTDTFIDQLGH